MVVEWVPDAPRVFDLGLRSRTVDHTAKTVTLELASDEALLIDYATLVEDTGALAHQGSIRAVCNYVLGKIGAALAPGGPDAPVYAYWPVTNLIQNPSMEVDTAGWAQGSNVVNFARIASGTAGVAAYVGGFMVWFGPVNAGISFISAISSITVTAGTRYTLSGYMRATAARPCQAMIRWLDALDGIIRDDYSVAVNCSTTAWTRVSNIAATAPPGAVRATLHFAYQAAGAGQTVFVDALMFYEGTELVPYFDGATPDAADYWYDWSSTVHASTSSRHPFIDRPPDVFTWQPGVTAWDFLAPLTASAGMRLFCDELRVWRLIDPATYEVPGSIPISPLNTTEALDTIARDDPEVFATGVVCRYVWTDLDGIARTATDSAGTPEKVVVIDYARAYPGPGTAAAILARRDGSGRTQDVTGLAVWAATPGMYASVTLPGTLDQLGKAITVEWRVDDNGLMTVGTRGLIDIPADSWLDVDPSEAWTDPPALTWLEW